MSRPTLGTLVALATLASLAMPSASHAQFGGLIKKKITQTAINKAIPQPAAPADTQAQRRAADDADRKARQEAWAHPTAITAANLGNFMTAIHAEQAERAKAASSPDSPLGRSMKYSVAKAKCTYDRAAIDTAMQKIQSDMQKQVTAGNTAALQTGYAKISKLNTDRIALSQRCDALKKPELTDADFALIRAEDAHEDSVGATAGGFTSLEYGRLRERVIAYALMPAAWKPSGYSPEELKAIDPRRVEIRKLLGADFDNSGQRISVE
jgi:hypothetical protein